MLQVVHQAGAYPRFCSMKRLEIVQTDRLLGEQVSLYSYCYSKERPFDHFERQIKCRNCFQHQSIVPFHLKVVNSYSFELANH